MSIKKVTRHKDGTVSYHGRFPLIKEVHVHPQSIPAAHWRAFTREQRREVEKHAGITAEPTQRDWEAAGQLRMEGT